MSSHAEIFTALADAMAAYNLRPELEKTIEELRIELDLYKSELEAANSKITNLETALSVSQETANALKSHLESANDDIEFLSEAKANIEAEAKLTSAHAATLEVELRGKDILIEALTEDKQELVCRLEIANSATSRLKEKLTAFINSVSTHTAPAVAETLTFPVANEPTLVEQSVHVEPVSESYSTELDLAPEITKPINPVNFLEPAELQKQAETEVSNYTAINW